MEFGNFWTKKMPVMTYSPTQKNTGSTIGTKGLNYCVRNGNRCFPNVKSPAKIEINQYI